MVNARLQELCDRADIFDCMYRYARGIDRMDRELLRSTYHDDAVDDHVGFVGPVHPSTGPSPTTRRRRGTSTI